MNLAQNDYINNFNVDAELLYVATESANSLFFNTKSVRTFIVLGEIGKAVGKLLIERNTKEKLVMQVDEFIILARKVGFSSEGHIIPESKTVDDLAVLVAQSCLQYAALRQLGMPSIIQPKTVTSHDYWPFDQEGGFCNPMKIKMMAED